MNCSQSLNKPIPALINLLVSCSFYTQTSTDIIGLYDLIHTWGDFLNMSSVRSSLKSPCRTVPHSHLGGADLKWVGVIPIDVSSRAEEGVHLLSEEVGEGVDGRHADGIGEGHLPAVVVQLHPDSGQLALQMQRGAGPRHGRVLTLVVRDHPKAPLGAARDAAFPVNGFLDHPEHPVRLVAHLHLPGVAAGREALRAQHEHKVAETLGIAWELLEGSTVGDTGQVWGEGQPGVGSVGVQGDGC